MARELWTDDYLTRQRQIGDPKGDEAIRTIFADGDIGKLSRFMGLLVGNDDLPAGLPPEIKSFLDETAALPTWFDPYQIKVATRLFNTYGCVSLASLVCASLPECYTMRTGVRILDLTSQLGAHTNRRLHQTAAMVLAVMGPEAFGANGSGIRQTQKVRLIHAAIRFRIMSAIGAASLPAAPGGEVPELIEGAVRSVSDVIAHKGFDWQIERDGWPINQEDLAFTLLTFGYVIPRAMRRFGVKLTDDECNCFLHAWNLSAYVLGVDENLMAHTIDDAEYLFDRIKARQAGPSDAGARLTDSLLRVVEKDILRLPILQPAAPILTRMLVGEDTAAMLGLNVRHSGAVRVFHGVVAAFVRTVQVLFSPLSQPYQPTVPLAARFGVRVVRLLCLETDDGKPRQVAIPPGWR